MSRTWLYLVVALVFVGFVAGQPSWQSQVEDVAIEQVASKACDTYCREEDFGPSELTPIGNSKLAFTVFVVTEDGQDGTVHLFVSDVSGTRMISNPTDPKDLTPLGDKVIFFANDRKEIWASDGKEQGTVLLAEASSDTYYQIEVVFKDKVYFSVGDGPIYQYWSTDGTPSGTAYFRDGSELFTFGDSLYIVDGVGGYIKSDGTFQGTMAVDFPPGANFRNWYNINNGLLFERSVTVYLTDGVDVFTVAENSRLYSGLISFDGYLAEANGRLVFGTEDASGRGITVWGSDGTPDGTVALTTTDQTAEASDFVAFGGHVYFVGDTDGDFFSSNYSMWRTDGTVAGTSQVDLGDIQPWGLLGGYCGKFYYWGYPNERLYATDLTSPAVQVSNVTRSSFASGGDIINGELYFHGEILPEGTSGTWQRTEGIYKIVNEDCSTAGTPACATLGASCNESFSCCDSSHECAESLCVAAPSVPTAGPISQPPTTASPDLLWGGFPEQLFTSRFTPDGSIISVYNVFWQNFVDGCEGGAPGLVATCPVGAVLMSPSIENGALPVYACEQLDPKSVACYDYVEGDFPQNLYIACYGATEDDVRINITVNSGEYVCSDFLQTVPFAEEYGGIAYHIIRMEHSCPDGNEIVNCEPSSADDESPKRCEIVSDCAVQFSCDTFGCTGGKSCTLTVPETTMSLSGNVCTQNFTRSIPTGQECDYNVMCQSGNCIGGICQSELLQTGDEGCREAADCVEGECGKAEYTQEGTMICCPSTVVFGTLRYCGGQPPGAPCFDNKLCSSGLCTSGTCGGDSAANQTASGPTEDQVGISSTSSPPPQSSPTTTTTTTAVPPTSGPATTTSPAESEPTTFGENTVTAGGASTSQASYLQLSWPATALSFTALFRALKFLVDVE